MKLKELKGIIKVNGQILKKAAGMMEVLKLLEKRETNDQYGQ